MSEFVATAGIRLRADPTGFRANLRETLITSTKGISAKVPVTPDMKGFRASLITGVNAAKAGVVVKIPVEAGQLRRQVGGAARDAQASASTKSAGALAKESTVVEKLTISEKTLATAMQKNISLEQQQVLLSQAHSAATTALSQALKELSVVENNRTRQNKASALAAVQNVENARERIRVDKEGAEEAAAAAKKRTEAQDKLTDLNRAATDVAHEAALIEDRVAKKTATSAEAKRLGVLITKQESIAKRASAAASIVEDAAAEKANNEIIKGAAARKLENEEIVKQISGLEANTKSRLRNAAAAAKGVGATAAAATGIRGATLAASGPFLAGAIAVTAFFKALGGAANLESTLNVFAKTTNASADAMIRAQEEAIALGKDITLPGVAASDAAEAFTELGKAGLSVEDSLAGARGVLQLATAASISNAEATELAASALNTFGLAGTQAEHVADLLTGASIEAQGSITDMGIALQQSGAAANQVGVSLEDTVALITLLARNGLRGSDAGTSLRTAFLRLINPTDRAQKVLDKLNVTLRDAEGNIRPEAFADLGTALSGLGKKQRDAALATVFGADAFRSAAILARESVGGLDEVREATQQQGLAADLAGARTAGFTGQVEALKNSLATLGTSFGQFLIGPAGSVVDTATELTTAIQDLADALDQVQASTPGGGFLSNIFGDIPVTGGDFIREFRSAIELAQRGEFGLDSFDSATETARKFNEEIIQSVDTTKELAAVLRSAQGVTFTPVPGTSINALEKMKDSLIGNSVEVKDLREQLTDVQRLIAALGRAPTQIELDVFLEKGFVDEATIKAAEKELATRMKTVGATAGGALLESMTASLDPGLFNALGFGIIAGVQEGIDKAPKIDLSSVGLTPAQIEAQVSGFEARGTRAEIAGDTAGRLRELGEERAFLEKEIDKAARAGQKTLRTKLENTLLGVINEIDSINSEIQSAREQQKNEAEQRRRDIEQAAKEAHDAQIKIFENAISRQQNRILAAAATKSLADDLASAKRLKRIIKGIIASGKLTKDELITFRNALLQASGDIRKVRDDILAAKKEQADRLRESIELDIEFANTREKAGAEIAARQRLIKFLQRQQRGLKKTSIEYKKLRNEIAAERQAIKDLKKEAEDRNNAFAELTFEFLKAQQGFAANLLGNLIPIGATGGLVGNTSPAPPPTGGGGRGATGVRFQQPDSAAQREGQIAQATGSGATSLQTANLLEVNKQMLRVLQLMARGQGFKEAKSQSSRTNASMDYGI